MKINNKSRKVCILWQEIILEGQNQSCNKIMTDLILQKVLKLNSTSKNRHQIKI
jgi:hypothetical protein